MKTRDELVLELRKVIAETAQLIQWCESAMRAGLPVIDLEVQRIRLATLRRIERALRQRVEA